MRRAANITLLLSTVLGILSTACGQDNETAEAPDCCYVVEATETCADLTNGYWNVASTIELNGVNAIQCCKDPSAVMNMDGGWCTGSAGSSEEATVPSNTFTEVSSNSSVVESHTEEHSESRTEESHTETSTTTTTTTTDGAASSTTCNIASGLCICTGTCPAETSTWGNVMDDDGICIALKDGALQVVKGSGQIVNKGEVVSAPEGTINVNGQTYNLPFDTCPESSAAATIGTLYYASILVAAAVVGGVMAAL